MVLRRICSMILVETEVAFSALWFPTSSLFLFLKWVLYFSFVVSGNFTELLWPLKYDSHQLSHFLGQLPQDLWMYNTWFHGPVYFQVPQMVLNLIFYSGWVILHSPSPCLILLLLGQYGWNIFQWRLKATKSLSNSAFSWFLSISFWAGTIFSLLFLLSVTQVCPWCLWPDLVIWGF